MFSSIMGERRGSGRANSEPTSAQVVDIESMNAEAVMACLSSTGLETDGRGQLLRQEDTNAVEAFMEGRSFCGHRLASYAGGGSSPWLLDANGPLAFWTDDGISVSGRNGLDDEATLDLLASLGEKVKKEFPPLGHFTQARSNMRTWLAQKEE